MRCRFSICVVYSDIKKKFSDNNSIFFYQEMLKDKFSKNLIFYIRNYIGFSDIKKYFHILISENEFFLSRIQFSDIRKWFFYKTNWILNVRNNPMFFWYQQIIFRYQKFLFIAEIFYPLLYKSEIICDIKK